MKRFQDKVVWITGASSGIGEALVAEFALEGASIILSSRRVDELQRVQKKYCSQVASEIIPLDLEKTENYPDLVDKIIKKFGKIDIVIHNGGVSQRSLVRDTQFFVFEKIQKINYLGTVALTLATLPIFRKQKFGTYVVVTSIVGKIGTPLRSGYAASKHALHGFFESLRAEEYESNLHILMVLPGYIKTNVSIHALTGDGSPQGTMDDAQAHGIDSFKCAKKIINAIYSKKDEIIIAGFKERLALFLNRFFPSLLRKALRKAKVT